MLNVVLSARLFDVVDGETSVLSETASELDALLAEIEALAPTWDALVDSFELDDFGSDRVVFDWSDGDDDGLLTLTGEDLGLSFAGITGRLTGVTATLAGEDLLELLFSDGGATLEIGGTRLEIGGEVDLGFDGLLDLFDLLQDDLDDVEDVLSDLGDIAGLSIEGISFGSGAKAPILALDVVSEGRIEMRLGDLDVIFEGDAEGDLVETIEGLGLRALLGEDIELEDLTDAVGLSLLEVTDADGLLLRAEGDFATNRIDTLEARGTAGADRMRLAGTEADRIEMAGKAGADRLGGSAGDDVIAGQRGRDQLWGQRGDDSLSGGRGRDTLEGGAGDDQLRGGAGADSFKFEAGDGVDRVLDFTLGQDALLLDWDTDLDAAGLVAAYGRIGKAGHAQLRLDAETKITFVGIDDPVALVDSIDPV